MHALHVKLTQQGCSINYMVANRDSLSYGRRARLLSPYSNGGQVARLRRGPAKSGQAGWASNLARRGIVSLPYSKIARFK
jgi:hypothetical protein